MTAENSQNPKERKPSPLLIKSTGRFKHWFGNGTDPSAEYTPQRDVPLADRMAEAHKDDKPAEYSRKSLEDRIKKQSPGR